MVETHSKCTGMGGRHASKEVSRRYKTSVVSAAVSNYSSASLLEISPRYWQQGEPASVRPRRHSPIAPHSTHAQHNTLYSKSVSGSQPLGHRAIQHTRAQHTPSAPVPCPSPRASPVTPRARQEPTSPPWSGTSVRSTRRGSPRGSGPQGQASQCPSAPAISPDYRRRGSPPVGVRVSQEAQIRYSGFRDRTQTVCERAPF